MSDVDIACPQCSQQLTVPEDLLGQVVECPSCKSTFQSPVAKAASVKVTAVPAKAAAEFKSKKGDDEATRVPMLYAGLWRRCAAFCLDQVIVLGAVHGLLSLVLGTAASAGPPGNIAAWGQVGLFLAGWLYYAVLESSPGRATVGKELLGIVVVDGVGKRVSFRRATARMMIPYGFLLAGSLVLGMILTVLTPWAPGQFLPPVVLILELGLVASYLIMIWSRRKQTLYDLLTKCVVVHRIPDDSRLRELSLRASGLLVGAVAAVSLALVQLAVMIGSDRVTGAGLAVVVFGSLFLGAGVGLLVVIVRLMTGPAVPDPIVPIKTKDETGETGPPLQTP
jgi:uncharacterized RDD family membrane protein YckC